VTRGCTVRLAGDVRSSSQSAVPLPPQLVSSMSPVEMLFTLSYGSLDASHSPRSLLTSSAAALHTATWKHNAVVGIYVLPPSLLYLIHDLLFLPISTIESAVDKRLITHCCVSRLACSRLSGHIEPHSPRLQA